ncbi:MAG: PD40 domain-containing protein [Phycisphaeraceae bacterium]|nr:PD40 domain-containing protein [Phycisphaeraceae bacterium]
MPIAGLAVLPVLALMLGPASAETLDSASRSDDAERAGRVAGADSEGPLLTGHIQLTHRDRFVKAGEAYFDHQSPPRWVIFQAVPVPPTGKEPQPHYAIYVAKLRYRGEGDRAEIVGMDDPIEISPGESANTCGWFHPTEPGLVIYGSTIDSPTEPSSPGYQRGTSRYRWEFAPEMRIVRQAPRAMYLDAFPQDRDTPMCGTTFMPQTIVGDGSGYVAEGSISPDGRHLLYAKMVDADSRDLDLFVLDLKTGVETRVVEAPGYDGGPFFSPDGRSICYRSDRRGNSELQIFVARLAFDDRGNVTGSHDERALTDDEHVNWAPYWHPSGRFLVYGSSRVDHRNYEIFAVELDWEKPVDQLRQRRITFMDGADVLPVFSGDGRWMMWTAQRGPMVEGESRPSSQVWVARVNREIAENPDAFFGDVKAGADTDAAR